MCLAFYRQQLLCLPFGICSLDQRKKGNSKDEKWQMLLEVDGGLHSRVSGDGRGVCLLGPWFQGGVGMEISTVVRGREVFRNL